MLEGWNTIGRTMRRLLLVILGLLSFAMASAVGPDSASKPVAEDAHSVVHGMTISCRGSGRIWGSDEMVATMAELKSMGVNWVTIHPYAGIRGDGTVGGSRINRMYQDTTWLIRPIVEAHRLGLKIMIKPHIAYWGSSFSWRGEIKFDTAKQWQRFFETYQQWITMVAQLSKDADAYVVGTELGSTVHYEKNWRQIIAAVRQEFRGPLTYSANWDRFEKVPFWDALDIISIQSYFPLVDQPGLPTQEELEQAWGRLTGRLERYAAKHDRKILLAELGYNRSAQAALRPWESRQGGEHAEEIQRRCLAAALKSVDESDAIVGAFLWKWFPGEYRGRGSFLKSTPTMRTVIREHWESSRLQQ